MLHGRAQGFSNKVTRQRIKSEIPKRKKRGSPLKVDRFLSGKSIEIQLEFKDMLINQRLPMAVYSRLKELGYASTFQSVVNWVNVHQDVGDRAKIINATTKHVRGLNFTDAMAYTIGAQVQLLEDMLECWQRTKASKLDSYQIAQLVPMYARSVSAAIERANRMEILHEQRGIIESVLIEVLNGAEKMFGDRDPETVKRVEHLTNYIWELYNKK